MRVRGGTWGWSRSISYLFASSFIQTSDGDLLFDIIAGHSHPTVAGICVGPRDSRKSFAAAWRRDIRIQKSWRRPRVRDDLPRRSSLRRKMQHKRICRAAQRANGGNPSRRSVLFDDSYDLGLRTCQASGWCMFMMTVGILARISPEYFWAASSISLKFSRRFC